MTGAPEPGAAAAATQARDIPAAWAALAPTREAMLGQARAQASEIIAEARRRAAETIGVARRQAAGELARGRQEGLADAEPLAVARRSNGRRAARSLVLAAQREAYEELRAQVREAVGKLAGEPGYERLCAQLSQAAARLAGPGAEVTEDPAGGVTGSTPGIVVDCSLPRLAGAAADAVDVAWLWERDRHD